MFFICVFFATYGFHLWAGVVVIVVVCVCFVSSPLARTLQSPLSPGTSSCMFLKQMCFLSGAKQRSGEYTQGQGSSVTKVIGSSGICKAKGRQIDCLAVTILTI